MKIRKTPILLAVGSVVLGLSTQVVAHTRLSPSSADENRARHATYETAAAIAHGCGENRVIGHMLVMPDQQDSIVETSSDGQTWTAHNGPVSDFIQAGGFIRVIKDRNTFDIEQLILDPLGNPIGYWAGGGEGLPPHHWVGKMPLRIQAVVFQDNSCARSLTLIPAIADVCGITSVADFNDEAVNFWVKAVPGVDPNSEDAKYFGDCSHACDSPATFKVRRDLNQFPLPASCGQGVDVRVYPSMNQLKRDMKAVYNGQQIWPVPHSH